MKKQKKPRKKEILNEIYAKIIISFSPHWMMLPKRDSPFLKKNPCLNVTPRSYKRKRPIAL
jgi:hypothetical protein